MPCSLDFVIDCEVLLLVIGFPFLSSRLNRFPIGRQFYEDVFQEYFFAIFEQSLSLSVFAI